MEANLCDINHLDSDVLLPPRKRLLAGLKKQNSIGNSHLPFTSATSSEFDTRLNNLLRSHLKNPNLSPEEIVESSRSAAVAAGKVAESARAVADEKAEKAAKAVAAAKSALELVATVSDNTAGIERNFKKNKMKKHVQVEMLYTKQRLIENCNTDEELARKLHRAINSSPRISKYSSTSDLNNHKRKGLKNAPISEKTRVSNGVTVWEGNPPSTSNGNGIAIEVDSEGSVHELYAARVDKSTSKFNKADRLKMDSEEVESSHPKERICESLDDTCSNSRKRGRLKQKKLPLSICTFRDRENPKEELKSRSSLMTEENMPQPTISKMPLFPVPPSGDGVMPVETTSVWKCQAFKAPPCVKQNKAVQS